MQGSITLISTARSAASREDWSSALEAWKEVGRLSEESIEGLLGQAEAYRALNSPAEADAVLSRYITSDATFTPDASAEVAVSYALNAQLTGDWLDALERWRAARLAFSHAPATWAGEAAMLQILNRFAEADELTSEGVKNFPNSIDIAAQHCNIALLLRDWLEADLRVTEIEKSFPDHHYTKTAVPRIQNEIKTAVAGADAATLCDLAAKADAANKWAASAKIWRMLHERAPDHAGHVIKLGYALRESAQYDEADVILVKAKQMFPDLVEIHAQYAEVAAARHDWGEAARRWQETLERFPNVPVVWMLAAISYREAGLTGLADSLLEKAIDLEPERAELHVYHAMNAERAGDWSKAVASWNNAYRLRPDDQNILNSRGDAIWQETLAKLEDGAPTSREKADAAVPGTTKVEVADEEATLKQLVLGFEGLGDNCEFGMVQRHFGADPIGLFRFAAVNAVNLATMITEELVRLGDTAFTELDLTSRGEYLIRDTRQFYLMHCFVQKDTVEPAKFLKQQLTRLGFLKRKLLEDLRNAEKIFVYKASFGISDDEITALYEALANFGPNILLVVRKVEGGHRAGSLHVMADRLLIGYVATLYDSDDSPIDYTSWRSILVEADRYKNGLPSPVISELSGVSGESS